MCEGRKEGNEAQREKKAALGRRGMEERGKYERRIRVEGGKRRIWQEEKCIKYVG